jgi:hypothetical protein
MFYDYVFEWGRNNHKKATILSIIGFTEFVDFSSTNKDASAHVELQNIRYRKDFMSDKMDDVFEDGLYQVSLRTLEEARRECVRVLFEVYDET